MADKDLVVEEADRALECSICLAVYKDPKQLPCLHTFCFKCLIKYCEIRKGDQIPCPLCQRKFCVAKSGVDLLPDNEVIARLVLQKSLQMGIKMRSRCDTCMEIGEETEVDSFCVECKQSLCHRCKMIHTKFNFARTHKIVSIEEKPTEEELQRLASSYCNYHSSKEIELYCCDCKVLICVLCHATGHSKHVCKVPYDIAKEKKKLCATDMGFLEKYRSQTSDKLQTLMMDNQDLLQQLSSTESAVRNSFANVRRLLEVYETEILTKLSDIKTDRLKKNYNEKNMEELRHTALDSFLTYSRIVMERATDCEIIRVADKLHKRAEELIVEHTNLDTRVTQNQKQVKFSESSIPSREDIKKIVGEISFIDCKKSYTSACWSINKIMEPNVPIRGVTVVNDELFVVDQSQVYVYDSQSLKATRSFTVEVMNSPMGISGCSHNRVLYISDKRPKCIHKVDFTNKSVTTWNMNENHQPRGLSVTAEHTLFITVRLRGSVGESGIVECTSEGQLLRVIIVDKSITNANQIVQLSTDQFIVSHGESLDSSIIIHRACVTNAKGQIIKHFGREKGDGIDQLCEPHSVAIDENNKYIFVADTCNHRVLMFDAELTCLGEVHAPRDLEFPYHLYFDSSTDRLFVGERFSGRLLVISPQRH